MGCWSPVEDDRRRFRLVWLTLDMKRRMRVSGLAILGRRAPDPETAWFVYMFALGQLRLRWFRLLAGIALLGVVVWAFARTHEPAPLLVLQFVAGVIFLLASLWTHSRAVRVNRPIARAPDAR
jgi:hypothetical protein